MRYGACQRNPGAAAAIWQMLVNLGQQNCHGKAVLSQLGREYFLMHNFVVVPSQHKCPARLGCSFEEILVWLRFFPGCVGSVCCHIAI